MKNYLPIFLLIFIFELGLAQKKLEFKLIFEGRNRECIVSIPTHQPPAGGYPIVFMLHGTTGNGEEFYIRSQWKELGQQENFITVFPSSLTWCFVDSVIEERKTRWVNGNVTDNPCSVKQNYVDDVKFLKHLVKLIKDTFEINSSKVYASGFSNGSAMTHKLAIDAGDVFAAVTACSGSLPEGDSTTPLKRIPIWFMVGSHDDRFYKAPITELPYGGDSILFYLQRPLTRTLACQNLTETFIKTENSIFKTYKFQESQTGLSQSPYIFSLIKDMEHVYPNGTNYPLSAAKMSWEFFKQTASTNTTNNSLNYNVEVFPNPSQSEININIHSEILDENINLNIINSCGNIILSKKLTGPNNMKVLKSELGSGVFFLQIRNNRLNICKKIIFI
ncbi:MAG: T9SS type A sorting domain-containing protein [Saprospiraceae bacterium]|nr:T9SS type A sorting domain-containing protein [Saprospiraceae bacterium]